jgi:hypothetical protein
MDFSAAAQWVDEAMNTQRLDDIYQSNPELGAQIDRLCKAVKAAAAHAMQGGARNVVNLCLEATAPFKAPDPNDVMMSEIAAWFSEIAPKKVNSTGHTGVVFNKECRKYEAKIRINGKKTYLGLFATAEEAGAAYQAAARERAKAS